MSEPRNPPAISSRLPAVLFGALVPLFIGVAAMVVLFGAAGQAGAPFRSLGMAGRALLILPGTLMVGALFAFPIAVAQVFTMTWLMRRTRHADHLAAWTLAGAVFALPLALTFGSFDAPHAPPFGFLVGMALGAIGGLAAGLKRPERQA